MNQDKQKATNFAKYSGIAFQLLATIGVFAFVGYKIDEHRGTEKLIFTAIFGLLGVALSLYQVVRSLNKDQGTKNEE
jgi:F0F1-type ATP synthase assembly protein I